MGRGSAAEGPWRAKGPLSWTLIVAVAVAVVAAADVGTGVVCVKPIDDVKA